MKNLMISSLLVLTIASCGKNNKVNSQKPTPVSPPATTTNLEVAPVVITVADFVGSYDLLLTQSGDCSPGIQIKKECDGLTLRNSRYLRAEDFCNINKTPIQKNRSDNDRVEQDDNREERDTRVARNEDDSSTVVTFEGSEVKSVVTLSKSNRLDSRRNEYKTIYTNSLIINKDGTLTKNFNLKSKSGSCVYKRINYSPTSQIAPL